MLPATRTVSLRAMPLSTCVAVLCFLGVSHGFAPAGAPMRLASKGNFASSAGNVRRNKMTSLSMVYIPSGNERPSSSEADQEAERPSKAGEAMKLPMDRNAFLALAGVAGLAGVNWVTHDHSSRIEQRQQAREATVAKIQSEEPPVKETPAEARRRRQEGRKAEKTEGGVLETTVFVVKSVAQGVATVATVSVPLVVKAAEFVGKDVILPTAHFTGEVVIPTVVPAVRHAVEASAPALQHAVEASAPVVKHAVDEATPLAAPLFENAAHALEGAEQSVLPALEEARAAASALLSSSAASLRPALALSEDAAHSFAALKDTSAAAMNEALRPAIDAVGSAAHATGDTTALLMAKVQPMVDSAEMAAKSARELGEGVREAVEPAIPALQATWGFAQGAYALASTAVSSVEEKGFGPYALEAAGQASSAVGAFVIYAAPKVLQLAETAAEFAYVQGKALLEVYIAAHQDTSNL